MMDISRAEVKVGKGHTDSIVGELVHHHGARVHHEHEGHISGLVNPDPPEMRTEDETGVLTA